MLWMMRPRLEPVTGKASTTTRTIIPFDRRGAAYRRRSDRAAQLPNRSRGAARVANLCKPNQHFFEG
jgi:hypothetical protein